MYPCYTAFGWVTRSTLAVCLAVNAFVLAEQPPDSFEAGPGDVLIADFEQPDYGGWKVEGDAFGTGPATADNAKKGLPQWYEGKGLADSYARGGDEATGTLTSPAFGIRRRYVNFLINGGAYHGRTCINLLIGGAVVRSATGTNNGEPFLNWKHWDVAEFKGREAVIEIVDQAIGQYGSIRIDQILQSDRTVDPYPYSAWRNQPAPEIGGSDVREIPITGRYLIFPGGEGAAKNLTVLIDGRLVHRLSPSIPADQKSITWWGWLDMSDCIGKTARVSADAPPEIRALIESGDEIKCIEPLYDEALRPQLRFSQMRGWNNDAHGMFHHDGAYHFFWQFNPGRLTGGDMHWGHATSPDMIHWTEQPFALRPNGGRVAVENRHPSMADGPCWSGSGHVDLQNTGGWQVGDRKTLVLVFYDLASRGESIAYSTDGGTSWKFYEENPVIKHAGRDAKLVWYQYDTADTPLDERAKQLGGHWVIAVYDEDPRENGKGLEFSIAFYTSTDLRNWTRQTTLPGYSECPELFELPVDGDPGNTRWVVFGGGANYAIGTFDGRKFTYEGGKRHGHKLHHGKYYASQCFSNPPDGRVVQIGWAKRIEMPGMPFNQAFSLPTRLTLRTTEDGIRMFANPIRELEQLRKPDPQTIAGKSLTSAAPAVSLPAKTQLYDILVTLKQGSAKKAVLRFGENVVTYDFGAQRLDEMPLKMKDGMVTFRIIVDRPMYEIVGGAGSCYKTWPRADKGRPLGTISLTAEDGSLAVGSLVAHEMKSIWRKLRNREGE